MDSTNLTLLKNFNKAKLFVDMWKILKQGNIIYNTFAKCIFCTVNLPEKEESLQKDIIIYKFEIPSVNFEKAVTVRTGKSNLL